MRIRKALAMATAVAGLALVGAAPVSADPTQNNIYFDVVCDHLGTLPLTSFSSGAASPGLVVDSTQVLLVYAWHVDITFTPTVGEVRHKSLDYSRAAPQNGRLDFCTYNYERVFPTGVGVFDGWALISYTP
jgi:hypothetical protein